MMVPEAFNQAESVFFFDKFAQPVHLLLHQQGDPKNRSSNLQTTGLYQPFRQPSFVNKRIQTNVMQRLRHPSYPDLRFPQINSPWINNDITVFEYLQLYHMFTKEKVYPEYLWGHYGDGIPKGGEDLGL